MAPQLIVEMTADESKIFSSQQKLIRQQEQMIAKYKALAQAGKRHTTDTADAARGHDRAFGPSAQASLGTFASGLSKVAAVAASLAPSFAESAAELGRNLQQLKGGESGLAQLAQLASTPREFQSLQQQARQLYLRGAAPDLNSAAQQLFGLVSAEMNDRDRAFLSELAASGFAENPGELATSINTLQTTLGRAAGSARDIVNAGIAASAVAPAKVPELLAGTARSAGTAGRLGLKPEEILAATTLASKATGSAELGGTQVASLLRSIGENIGEFQSRDLAGIVREITDRNLSQVDLQKLLGRAESIEALTTLSTNMPQFQKLQRDILAAQRSDMVAERLQLLANDPALRTLRQSRQAAAQVELSNEQRALLRAYSDAAFDQGIANIREQGAPGFVTGAARVSQGIVNFLGLDRATLEMLQPYQPDRVRQRIEQDLKRLDAINNASPRSQSGAEGAQQRQVELQERMVNLLQDMADRRPGPPPLPQLSAARHEQSQSAETGK